MTDGPQIEPVVEVGEVTVGGFAVAGSWSDEPATRPDGEAPEFPDPFAT